MSGEPLKADIMRILDKYTIKSFLGPFIYCVASFIFMYIIIDLFGHLDEILRNKIHISLLARYYYLLIPIIFVQIAPVAMLLATVYVFSQLNRHNEITAMKSSGINVISILKPFLLVGISTSLLIMLVNEVFVPKATVITTKIKQDHIEHIKGTAKKDAVLEDVAIYGQGNRLYYIKEFDTLKIKLNEIIILGHDEQNNLVSKIIAKSARWSSKLDPVYGSNGKWVFYNCIIHNLDKNGELVGKPEVYAKKIIALKETPRDFYRGQFQADLMNFSQLYQYVKKFARVDKKITRRLAVDLYYKTAYPFISFIVVLLGAGFGVINRRGGTLWGIGTGILISFVYYGVMAVCLALGKGGWLSPLTAAWSANILFLAVGIALIKKLAN